jgi:hypothetical protein
MRYCERCGFPLGVRPRLLEKDGVCQMCINWDNRKNIDFKERQKWLTEFIQLTNSQSTSEYDCLVAVSGGKDSHTIVRRLIENHGIKNPLLVTVTDEFTHTRAGKHNIDNLVTRYDLDHITFRCKPQTFKRETLKDFENELHPLKWIEKKIYETPIEVAKKFGIPLVFYGENPFYEMGESEHMEVFHPASDEKTLIIFMGAIYPYSIMDSLQCAREIGFKDLDDFNEWPRLGSVEQFTQIDSIAYIMQLWTKFVKFGFQRVTDIATRFVREGKWTLEEAKFAIKQKDYICDPMAKQDFCDTIGITLQHFNNVVDKHANKDLVEKDVSGNWRLKD